MSEAEIDRVIALQMPDAEKRARADVVVRTGLSRFCAVRGVRRWLKEELGGGKSHSPPVENWASFE